MHGLANSYPYMAIASYLKKPFIDVDFETLDPVEVMKAVLGPKKAAEFDFQPYENNEDSPNAPGQ